MNFSRLITSLVLVTGVSCFSLAACGGDDEPIDGMGGAGSGGDATGTGGDATGTGGDTSTGGDTTGTGGDTTTGGTTGMAGATGMGGMGGGTASADCMTYCDDWFAASCNDHADDDYATEIQCLAVCATFDDSGTDGDMGGDTLQCRVTHVGLATQMAPEDHCLHAQQTATAPCVDQ